VFRQVSVSVHAIAIAIAIDFLFRGRCKLVSVDALGKLDAVADGRLLDEAAKMRGPFQGPGPCAPADAAR
jgi:hypothetical protein